LSIRGALLNRLVIEGSSAFKETAKGSTNAFGAFGIISPLKRYVVNVLFHLCKESFEIAGSCSTTQETSVMPAVTPLPKDPRDLIKALKELRTYILSPDALPAEQLAAWRKALADGKLKVIVSP
jgi:hypothetical protein